MVNIQTIRKENLKELVMDKFQGNRSAFSRAAGIHHNHINLLLSANDTYKRNMGEEMARRIESMLGLPSLWMDVNHSGDDDSTAVIAGMPIDVSLGRVLKTPSIRSITAASAWIKSQMPGVTQLHSLMMATVATTEAQPDVAMGDVVIIDTGVKAFVSDGVYLVLSDDVFLRRISRNIEGGYTISGASGSGRVDSIKSLTIIGKITQKILLCSI